MLKKIIELELKENKKFHILLFIEAFLLVFCFGMFLRPLKTVHVDASEFQGIELKRGTYELQVIYSSDTFYEYAVSVKDEKLPESVLRANHDFFLPVITNTKLPIWLLRNSHDLCIEISEPEFGADAEILGADFVETRAFDRIRLCNVLFLILIVDSCYLFSAYDKRFFVDKKKKFVMFLLTGIMILTAFPVLVDGYLNTADLGYHFQRIEGIRDGILSGQFPIRISPEWLFEYGFGSAMFYPETLLYIPALFRIIGYSMTTSYLIFMVSFAIVTVLVAYYCFKKVLKDSYAAVFATALQTVSIYRIGKVYCLGALGEMCGIMLMPLYVYGYYRVFSEERTAKGYKRSWIPLTIAFTLTVQSHLLSGEMAGLFTILLCLVEIKKVFKKETFIVLAKTVIYTCLLSAWYLVPFFENMVSGYVNMSHLEARTIQCHGLYPTQFLSMFINTSSLWSGTETYIFDGRVNQIGIPHLIALFVFIYIWAKKNRGILTDVEMKLGKIAASFACIAIVFSIKWFPWDFLQDHAGIFTPLISSIEYPHRFLTVATVLLSTVAGLLAKKYLHDENKSKRRYFVGGLTLILVINSMFYMEFMLTNTTIFHVYSDTEMGSGYISDAQFLPYGGDPSKYKPHMPKADTGVKISDYERGALERSITVDNTTGEAKEIVFDLLFYKGYKAINENTKEELLCAYTDNYEVTATVPAGYSGNVTVKFVSPLHWRIAELVTLLSAISMIVVVNVVKHKEKGNEYGSDAS